MISGFGVLPEHSSCRSDRARLRWQPCSTAIRATVPRLVTFGGLALHNGNVANGVGNLRSRLPILAVLAVAGDRGIRRNKLAALFWPDSDEERARNALRQSLFILKRDIGAGDITTGVSDIRLNTEVVTADVIDFETALRDGHFEDAAALYAGAFLDGVYLRESPEFERWADEQRTRLSREYDRALERAAADAAGRGDMRSAANWWERRSAHDPLSGRVARLYMEALAAAGDRERAIRHAAVHAQHVRQELEVEPDADVLRLADRLREAQGKPGTADARKSDSRGPEPSSQEPVPAGGPEATPSAGSVAWISTSGSGVRQKLRVWAALGVVVVVGAVVAVRAISAKGPPVQPGLVALGTFENRTTDAALNSLVDQAMSRIANALTESGHAGVIDLRESMDTSGRTAATLAALARRSAAEFLVRGAIDRRGDSLVVTGQVVTARSGRIRLQFEPVSFSLEARHRIPDELRERFGGAVVAFGDTLFPLWRMGRSRAPRYSAYHEFRQGLDALLNQSEEPAIQHFMKAMELDPEFPQAKLWYLEQAIVVPAEKQRRDSVRAVLEAQRMNMAAYDRTALDRQLAFYDGRLEDVYTAARAMMSLAPEAPDSKVLLAQAAMATRRYHEAVRMLHDVRAAPAWLGGMRQRLGWDLLAHRMLGDHDAGIAEWRRAVSEAPDDYLICVHGIRTLAAAGREKSTDSLLAACDRLPDAQPATDNYLQIAGRHYRMGGHHEAAERAFRRALALRRERARMRGRPLPAVADLHIDLGEWQAAYDILRSVTDPGEGARVGLAVAAAHVGDTVTALATLEWLKSRSRRNGADLNRAFIQVALGQRDSALASLRAAWDAGASPTWLLWRLRPELQPLRDDPRFKLLVRPIR